MAFTIPSLDQIHDFVIGVARALLPRKNWSRYAPGWKFLRGVSVATTEVHAHTKTALKDLMPDTASGEYLDRWGAIVGVTRKAATPSRKSAALRVVGSGDVTAGDVLVHDATGLRFQVNEDETVTTFANVDIVAIDTGRQTQLSSGEVLRFEDPPTGISEEATLVLDLDEDGDDAESDAAYQARILDRFRNPPLGGAQNDYVQWALEITGIASAYSYPGRAGRNSVDVAALHDGSGDTRILTSGENATLLSYIEERAPAGVALRVLTVEGTDVDVEVTYEPFADVAYEPDWDDSTAPTISSYNSSTRTATLSAARPASMQAGDRVVFKDITATPADSGKQWVIESLSSTNAFVLEKDLDFTPAAGDIVYSGGPLVDEIRDAIVEHIDELGTSNTDDNSYGSWEANLRPENVYRLVQSVEGVRRSTVVTPSAVVEPADNEYPDDGTVFVLTPRRVLVRKEW